VESGVLAVLDGTGPAGADQWGSLSRRSRSTSRSTQDQEFSGSRGSECKAIAPRLTSSRLPLPSPDGKLKCQSWRHQCEQASRRCDSWNCCSTNSETQLRYLHAPAMILSVAQLSTRNCWEKNATFLTTFYPPRPPGSRLIVIDRWDVSGERHTEEGCERGGSGYLYGNSAMARCRGRKTRSQPAASLARSQRRELP